MNYLIFRSKGYQINHNIHSNQLKIAIEMTLFSHTSELPANDFQLIYSNEYPVIQYTRVILA